MTSPFHHLNAEQKRAVEATEGPLLILAGAGAGKTKTIVERIKNLIKKGIDPTSILAITFTNKAAKEMRERVEKELDLAPSMNQPVRNVERPTVSTFHSLGVRILREQAPLANLKKTFAILDRDESKRAVKEALILQGLDPKVHEPGKILSIISREKGRGHNVRDFLDEGDPRSYTAEVVGGIWPQYEQILKRDNALDFDDLLLKTHELLRENVEVRNYYQKLWRYVHIDEYQDTNRVQYEISKMLVGPEKNICAVGDIDQNIYSWRGAELKNILAFEKDYPDATVITLEENYRSTKTILSAANVVIEKNKIRRPKNLFTANKEGEKITIVGALDEAGEADFIARKAKTLSQTGTPLEQMAVLYRANFQSRALEEAFLHHGVSYQVLGTRFFERKEVKDLIAYLRVSLDRECLVDMKRIINVPARGIGKATVVKIFAHEEASLAPTMQRKLEQFRSLLSHIAATASQKNLSETMVEIIKTSGLEEEWKSEGEEGAARLENAYELVNFAARYNYEPKEEAKLNFLTDASLQSDQDELKEERSAVRLMTVHAAKGLEFDTVFISGLEEGLFPHEKMNETNLKPEEAEEERRLFYVAITRARKKLFLSYAQLRTIFGRQQVNMPSEFILDIPAELADEESSRDDSRERRPLLEIDF